jgi:hypothetical protein
MYGFYTSKSQIFPYSLLTSLITEIKIERKKESTFFKIEKDQVNFLSSSYKEHPEKDAGNILWSESIEIPLINYEPKGILNSFEVYIDDKNFFKSDGSKVVAHKFEDNLIYKYSHNSFSVLKNSSISIEEFNSALKRNGGIKLLDKFQGQLISLVPLTNEDQECAYVVLINITTNKIIFKLPCIPDYMNVDFNGIGGGYVYDEVTNNLYLAVGAPESNSYIISKLSQDKTSYYGKILEIPLNTLIGNSNDINIFSSGIRSVLSMSAFKDNIIAVENGPRGGDEINRIIKSGNYGWPYVSLGDEYNLRKINKDKSIIDISSEVIIDPIFSFLPSIAPSTISDCPMVYKNFYHPYNCSLIGSLRGKTIYFALFDKDYKKLKSLESFRIGYRVRRLDIISDQEVLIFTDTGKAVFLKLKKMKDFDLLPLRDINL